MSVINIPECPRVVEMPYKGIGERVVASISSGTNFPTTPLVNNRGVISILPATSSYNVGKSFEGWEQHGNIFTSNRYWPNTYLQYKFFFDMGMEPNPIL